MQDWPSFGLEPLGRATHWADGAGNCFWAFRIQAEWNGDLAPSPEAIRNYCVRAQRETGKTADGILVVAGQVAQADARMVIFNSDGTRPEACGNALRCVPKLLGWTGTPRQPWHVETDAGPRLVWHSGPHVSEVSMGPIHPIQRRVRVTVAGETFVADVVSVGNPHLVLEADSVSEARIDELGPQLASHPDFPQGINVEFVFHRPEGHKPEGVLVRVWERGVGETLACGTGACAVAAAQFSDRLVSEGVELVLRGGTLRIGMRAGELSLLGPAWAEEISSSPTPGPETTVAAPHPGS